MTREEVVNHIGRKIRGEFGYDTELESFTDPILELWFCVIMRAVDDYCGGHRYAANRNESGEIYDRAVEFLDTKQVEAFGIDGTWFLKLVNEAKRKWLST